MKLLVVKYTRQLGQDDADQAANLMHAAEQLAGLPGLNWKIWIYDDSKQVAGAVYLFDSEEHARAWGDEALRPSLGRLPGISDIEATYFDVDERLSAVTRGPLTASQPA
jgi:Putative mono-oxygenase ydhR